MKTYNLLENGFKECLSDFYELTVSVEFGSEQYEFLCNLYYILFRLVRIDEKLHLVLSVKSIVAFVDVEPENSTLSVSACDRSIRLDLI